MKPPLPEPEAQFVDANGVPYAGGTVATFIPGTDTPKDTWTDQAGTALNTNPIVLDAAGRALIHGNGEYRFILKDALGNLIYDQLTWAVDTSTLVTMADVNDAVQAETDRAVAAESAEQAARIAADNAESAARIAGDANLQSQIDAINATLAGLPGPTAFPSIQGGHDISDSDGHKRVTFSTAYSSPPSVVVSAAGAGYSAETIVVHSDNTGLDVWFAFPSTTPIPVGPINFDWIATGPT